MKGAWPRPSAAVDRRRGGQVRLADRTVDLARLRAQPGAHRALLERARTVEGHGWCLCAEPAPRLVIRNRSGTYYLACWPGGGAEHSSGCDFHRDGGAWSGRSSYRSGALTEELDGTARASLSVPLSVRAGEPETRPDHRTPPHGSGGGRMSLLGLLHYLWERAELTTSPPGRRNWADCHPALLQAAGQIMIGDRPLTGSCYVVPPFDPAVPDRHRASCERFINGLGTFAGRTRRGLIVGAVRALAETPYGHRIDLRHHRSPLFVSGALYDRLRRAAPSVFAESRPPGSEQILLALIQRSETGNLSIVAAATMLTNRRLVPADSGHEVVMADALAAAGRAFYKPLRYDGDADLLPDFVLTDTDPLTAVEVWGMLGRADYAARQRTKVAQYRLKQTPLIEWDPSGPLPDLAIRP